MAFIPTTIQGYERTPKRSVNAYGGKGPDNLWCLKRDHYLLVECKNQVKAEREEIAKTETGQMNNSFAWFTENYPGANVSCVMVLPTKKVGEAAGFDMPVAVMWEGKLKRLVGNVQNFFKEFASCDLMDLDPATVQKWLNDHGLSTDLLISTYAEQVEK